MSDFQGDEFVSADVFLEHLERLPEPEPARHKRASVAVLANSNAVKGKIALFSQSSSSHQSDRAAAPILVRAPPTFSRPALRKPAAGPKLGAIAENEPAPSGTGHGSTHAKQAHKAAAAAAALAPVQPSPATKQVLAEKRDANRFQSVVFTARPPAGQQAGNTSRAPLAGGVAVLPPLPAGLPVTQPAPSSSSTSHAAAPAQGQQQQQAVEEEADEQFDDAHSAPSAEGSGAWHDAEEVQPSAGLGEAAAAAPVLAAPEAAPLCQAALAEPAVSNGSAVPSFPPGLPQEQEVASTQSAAADSHAAAQVAEEARSQGLPASVSPAGSVGVADAPEGQQQPTGTAMPAASSDGLQLASAFESSSFVEAHKRSDSLSSERSLSTASAPSLAMEPSERSLHYSHDNQSRSLPSPQSSVEAIQGQEAEGPAATAAAPAFVLPANPALPYPQQQRRASAPTAPASVAGWSFPAPALIARHSLGGEPAAGSKPLAAAVAAEQQQQQQCAPQPQGSEPDSPPVVLEAAAARLALAAAAASPAPASPATTEYDGDDVVMRDADFTPAPAASMRRAPPGSTRFRLEAIASAGMALARTPLAQSPGDGPLSCGEADNTPADAAAGCVVGAFPGPDPPATQEHESEFSAQQAGHGCAELDRAGSTSLEAEPEPMAAENDRAGSEVHAHAAEALHQQISAAPAVQAAQEVAEASEQNAVAEEIAPAALSVQIEAVVDGLISAEVAVSAEEQVEPKPLDGPAAQLEGRQAQVLQEPASSEVCQAGGEAVQVVDEALAFASRPRLSLSPAPAAAAPAAPTPGSTQQELAATDAAADEAALACAPRPMLPSPSPQPEAAAANTAVQEEAQDAAFARRPRLSMSPVAAHAPHAAAEPSPATSAASGAGVGQEQEHAAEAAGNSASAVEQAVDHQKAAGPAAAAGHGDAHIPDSSATQPATVQQQRQHALLDSPAMSMNPLASAATPPPSRLSRGAIAPAISGASGTVSNPLYAGTPGAPTPPSVTLKAFPSQLASGGSSRGTHGMSRLSASSSASSPASSGIKLAERLQEVAQQLQHPAAPQGLAAVLPGATPAASLLAAQTPGPVSRFEFAEDVQKLMQRLDMRTPATAVQQQPALGGRAGAMASTIRRPQQQQQQRVHGARPAGRLSLSSSDNSMLDLSGFDADGNRQTASTPLLHQHQPSATPTGPLARVPAVPNGASAPASAGPAGLATAGATPGTPAEVHALSDEVAALRAQAAVLQEEKGEVVAMLAHYQGSIAELQDKHSGLVVKLQAERELLQAQVEQERAGRAEVERKFSSLYHDKYLPLKQQAASLQADLANQQKRAAAAELTAQSAASEAAAAREQLGAAEQAAAAARVTEQQLRAEVAAAREAEQHLQAQLAAEARRGEKALAAVHAELEDMRARHSALTRQYDEAVHRANVARQARERALAEAQRKDEEACALEVRLRELEGVLRDYKRENSKFYEIKERYKGSIAALEREVANKEKEKQELLLMCNELMSRLERETLGASSLQG